jgi:hypothetical protein
MSLFTWAKTGQAQPGSRGAPAPWSRWHWLADSGGDLWQGGPGRAARATRRGGEPAGGISGRRVHRSGLSVVGGGLVAGKGHRQAGVGVSEQHTAGVELVDS